MNKTFFKSILNASKVGLITGGIVTLIIVILLEIITKKQFLIFLEMILGIFTCGIDGRGGLLDRCGDIRGSLQVIVFTGLIATGGFLGGVISALFKTIMVMFWDQKIRK